MHLELFLYQALTDFYQKTIVIREMSVKDGVPVCRWTIKGEAYIRTWHIHSEAVYDLSRDLDCTTTVINNMVKKYLRLHYGWNEKAINESIKLINHES